MERIGDNVVSALQERLRDSSANSLRCTGHYYGLGIAHQAAFMVEPPPAYWGLYTCWRMNSTMSVGRSTLARPESNTNLAILAAVCAALPIDLLWKQQILELRSEADRVDRLLRYLQEWAPHLEHKSALRQRAGGNGHVLN